MFPRSIPHRLCDRPTTGLKITRRKRRCKNNQRYSAGEAISRVGARARFSPLLGSINLLHHFDAREAFVKFRCGNKARESSSHPSEIPLFFVRTRRIVSTLALNAKGRKRSRSSLSVDSSLFRIKGSTLQIAQPYAHFVALGQLATRGTTGMK